MFDETLDQYAYKHSYDDPLMTVKELVEKYKPYHVAIEELPWNSKELLACEKEYTNIRYVEDNDFTSKVISIGEEFFRDLQFNDKELPEVVYVIFYQEDEEKQYYEDGDYSSWPVLHIEKTFKLEYHHSYSPGKHSYGDVKSVEEMPA